MGKRSRIAVFLWANSALLMMIGASDSRANPLDERPSILPRTMTAIPRTDQANPGAQPSSTLLPLPQPPRGNIGEARPSSNPTAVVPPVNLGIDTSLIPGRKIEPIDLLSVLRLAGERDLDIAIARQRIDQSLADLSNAR